MGVSQEEADVEAQIVEKAMRSQQIQKAVDWIVDAPAGLSQLMQCLSRHKNVAWQLADYESRSGDRGDPAETLETAEAVSSKVTAAWVPDRHVIAVDVDVPAWLVPSSTEGHSHLYVDLEMSWEDYKEWLLASAKIGLLEEGYVNAAIQRGMTSVRTPWTRKGNERPHEQVLAELAASDPRTWEDLFSRGDA